jgi:H+/Cl- antiporter ClcA
VTTPTDPAAPAAAPLTGLSYLRLLLLGALLGIPAALAAALFFALVHELQQWLWTDLPEALGASAPPWYLVVGLPVVGAAIVTVARVFLPGDGGHSPVRGLSMEPTPVAHIPGVVLAALGTLGFGAVLGPEAPVIALGSAVAIGITAFARLDTRETGMLGSAGSFSAISALFGGPVVGGVLMTEAGAARLGAVLLPALAPGFVAAAVGYVLFVGFGDWGGISSQGLTVPDLEPYEGLHLLDLALAPVVGLVTAVILAGVRRVAGRLAVDGERRLGMAPLLLLGGLAVGVISIVAWGLGDDPTDVLFSGQSSIPALVAEGSTVALLVLLVAKTAAYTVSLGCGFRGGPIFPAIFLGVGVATMAVDWFGLSPTWAVAVGAAAGMAGQAKLLLTAVVFGALLVGAEGLDATPAAVLAAVAAWAVATAADLRTSRPAPGPAAPS